LCAATPQRYVRGEKKGPNMSFSYNAVWEDTVRLLRQHAPLLAAIAGVFLFLPTLLFAVFMPPPVPQGGDADRALQIWLDFYRAAWPWFFLQGLFSIIGTLAMLRLVFARDTVGGALVHGLILTPFYILMSLIGAFMISFGLILLIVPGLYLLGRLAPISAVLVAENRRSPFDAIARTFALTSGHGWAIFGLVFVVAIVAAIAVGVANTLFGLVFILAAGQELGKLLAAVVASALNAAFSTLLVMLYAAIYRALAGKASVAAAFE
jgi:hypothetical protein